MEADLQIKCPNCKCLADFVFASKINIKKKDAKYFSKSKHFVLKREKKWSSWRTYYYAWYYPLLSPRIENIPDLPDGYEAGHARGGFGYYDYYGQVLEGNEGVTACAFCKTLAKHTLDWPQDAYFQIDYKGQTLWAYDRSYALKLLEYIKSNDRKKRIGSTDKYVSQDFFLRKIPEHFQTKKARGEVVKKLSKLLG